MKHVVQFSTGAGSAEVAWRVVEQYGPDAVTLLTADTLVEDKDNWRFAREVVDRLCCEWVRLADGRTPMEVGRDHRVVPNNQMAVCSRVLKRELLHRWIDENCDPADSVIYLGFDWTEPERHEVAAPHWQPYRVESPLIAPPYVSKPDLLALFRRRGIKPPRLYEQGFAHANCGGACVRGGQAQWQLLLRVNRPLYLDWENEEQITRNLLDKDVSILRDRTNGTTTPLTLRGFRERLDTQPSLFDADDWGACGCTDAFGSTQDRPSIGNRRRAMPENRVAGLPDTPPQLRDKCPGSQAFPTSYNGENTRCPACNRLLKLHVNGKVPTHNRSHR